MADYTADGYVAVGPDFAPVSVLGNQTAGDVAVTEPYTTAPDFRGGYYGEQIGASGGGYDPDNPSYGQQSNSVGGDVSVSENYTGAPSFAGGYNGEATFEGGGGYDPNSEESGQGGYDPGLSGLSDPTNARLATSGLKEGGENSSPRTSPSVAFQSTRGPTGTASATENDWRVRISLADRATIFYKDPNGTNAIMKPLIDTSGVIFPYTPTINISHAANYSPVNPTHSNYPQQFYNNSEVSDIQIAGDFTVQSIEEGQYLMAAVYFFRSATKMFFGSGTNVGNPPPMVFLDGYGSHYFPHVPCVISNFTHVLSADVDYIQVPITTTTLEDVNVQNDNLNIGSVQLTPEEQQYVPSLLKSSTPIQNPSKQITRTQFQTITTNTRVPTSSTITITLKPVYSRKGLHDRFDLNKFAMGTLLRDRTNGYGGFL